ncbi:site-specific integrase [Pseudoclavibacter sp. CFCC 14310]|uniref:tyrosine-type recombinase/integrase n=1 Tax=Pseudoclavibacter sp. CFCC 14310 TaxID=2615180 RepID=UPI00130151AB|nr:site-specific integrase [Pseudoclavibacter sp. CFCC 14310]KAB1647452.1 site-specific integrase [Pseudoclavibacter sp. CFCC 14310]
MASIREYTRKDGSRTWRVLWRDPDDGGQHSTSFTREADAKRFKIVLEQHGGSFESAGLAIDRAQREGVTMGQLFDAYIKSLTAPSEDTVAGYRSIRKVHLQEQLGAIPVVDLSADDLVSWIRWMQGRAKSVKTISNAWGSVLSPALRFAVQRGMREDNPCDTVRLPKEHARTTRRIRPLTKAEYDRLEQAMCPQYRLFTRFLLETGMRFGEATALTWEDIDLDPEVGQPVVRVTKAWKGSYGHQVIGAPKSEHGVRDIAIPRSLAAKLNALPRPHRSEFVFTNRAGGHLTSSLYHRFGWKQAIETARLPDVRPHDLRHTHASWLLQAGVELFKVSRRLGHASVSITEKVYGHLMPQAQQDAVDALERIMGA